MGMDAIDIAMGLEKRFGVKLEQSDLLHVRTVADVAAMVITKLPRHAGICPTARAFYELRRLFVRHGGVERKRVRPRARLDELFPLGARRRWEVLREHEPRLPGLRKSKSVDGVLVWLVGLSVPGGVLGFCIAWVEYGAPAAIVFAVGAIGAVVSVHALITRVFGVHFPKGIETVGDVARAIALPAVAAAGPGERLIAQQKVLGDVRLILANVLGKSVEDVRAESELVRDLGM